MTNTDDPAISKEVEAFRRYIERNHLKMTKQRELILETFLCGRGHASAEELYQTLIEKDPSIGLATVYRTLSLLCDAGLAQQRHFGDGQTRYEHDFEQGHHDHLICVNCGKIQEFFHPHIETLLEQVVADHNFTMQNHRVELYGLCPDCQK